VLPDGGVTCGGLKLGVTPDGASGTVNWTSWLKPFADATVIVEVPELPRWIVKEVGKAVTEKSGSPSVVKCVSTDQMDQAGSGYPLSL
jgi:hypothetical protein